MTNQMIGGPTADRSEASSGLSADVCCCGHQLARHDQIARRYCRATILHSLPRGCICLDKTPVDAWAGTR